jgi:ribosomal protein S25
MGLFRRNKNNNKPVIRQIVLIQEQMQPGIEEEITSKTVITTSSVLCGIVPSIPTQIANNG